MKKKKEVWSAQWDNFQKDDQSILKHTHISAGFPQECYDLIKKNVPKNAKNVLEVGCGTGRFSLKLAQDFPQINFEGNDLSAESIHLAQAGAKLRNIPNVTFYTDDITKPQPRQKAYDLIFSEGIIEHFRGAQDLTILKLLKEFVAPGGTLLFGVPNYRCYVHTINKALALGFYKYGFERSYKKEDLQKYLTTLGLTEKKVIGLGFTHGLKRYGFPYNLLAKKYEKILLTDPAKAAEWNDKYGFFIFASGKK